MPMEYRKKPVTIEAIQFTDSDERVQELIEFTHGNFAPHRDLEHYAYAVIKTLEGDHRADIGDYIIKGVQGEFYPCKPDIFDMTYEAVEEYCCTCRWYAVDEGVCCNGASNYRADFRSLDDTCEDWEEDDE